MAVLLIVVPLLLAFLSILNKKYSYIVLILAMVFNVVFSFYVEKGLVEIGHFGPVGINLLVDQYALIALWFVNSLFFVITMTHCASMKKLSTVLLVLLAGLNGLILTHDLFNLFVFLEITGIATYLLTTENKKYVATFNYLIQGTVGSGLYLIGLMILYAMIGTLNMNLVFVRMNELDVNPLQVSIPFALMFIGLGVEAKLLPFNSWVKGILEEAKPLSGTLITSVIAGTILLVFGRLLSTVMVVTSVQTILVVILIATMVLGEAAAFKSTKLREILLFSSVGQAGLIVYLFMNGILNAAILLVIANMLSKFILFGIGASIADKLGDEVEKLRGVFRSNILLGISFTVAALSVAGLPVFFGFVVKLNILLGLISQNDLMTPIILLIVSLIEGVYFIRLIVQLWNGETEAKFTNTLLTISTLVVAFMMVVLGIYYQPITNMLASVTTDLLTILQGGVLS